MAERFAVLPCNGLDKPAGPLAREIALALVEACQGELICPVLYNNLPALYAKALELPLIVIDGCGTRCASKLATEHDLKVRRKLQVTDALKEMGESAGETLTPDPERLALCRRLAERLLAAPAEGCAVDAEAAFAEPVEYATVTHDKFIFRIPTQGYLFNENHCWAHIAGSRARVGISDYMQQELGDLTFCELPQVGTEVEQFGEIGSVESVKAVSDIISPVSGRVVAVNAAVVQAPELINEEPYVKGWVAEVELRDLENDRALLLDGETYLALVRQKAAEYRP
ncbi:MAG TPA: glycine cleavage system protein GcvH [Armatimonadota bacterium]|nr:glycine cleavage system protein GcvH [Armatimonadota bacterium]